MDVFDKIDKFRKLHNYPSKMYRTALRKTEKGLESKLEINTSKYFEIGSPNYLKKNKRILKETQGFELYTKYIEALLTKSTDLLVEVRTSLQNYSSFVEELDTQLSSLDYDTTKLKYKFMWNDLEILFNSEEKVEEFKKRTLVVRDTKYNSLVVKHIFNLEKRREQLDRLVLKDSSRIRCILSKVKVLLKAVEEFIFFLKENYVESEYLSRVQRETRSLRDYYQNLLEGKREEFEVPELFKGISSGIVESGSKQVKDKKKIRKEILEEIEKYLSTSTPMNVPFIPDFYDIAFDYIRYPPVEEKLEETFINLNISQ